MQVHDGFIISRQQQDTPRGILFSFWVKLGPRVEKIDIAEQRAVFFLHQDDVERVQHCLADIPSASWELRPLSLKTLDHQDVVALYSSSLRLQRQIIQRLTQQGIALLEEDIRPVDRYLMERFIFGGVAVLKGPEGLLLRPAEVTPALRVLSIDIETSMRGDVIHSIGLHSAGEHGIAKVLMRDAGPRGQRQVEEVLPNGLVQYVADERALLRALVREVQAWDPDIFIGWNVIGFDFRVLAARAQALQVPLTLGRTHNPLQVHQSEQGKWYVRLDGRLVIDGIDTLKGATYHFESYALEFVAQQLFQRGKLIHQPNDRGAEIQRLFREDKPALARYNLEDCRLVSDIFAHTKLMDYLIERARLTGLALDKVGGSAAAFDFQYLPRLHRYGYVAPQYASGAHGLDSPGGYVMDSQPGLYSHVLVLDFKSLYPSIIQTFCVDPAGMADALGGELSEDELIPGFNGAIFRKQGAILPQIITELWAARDEAKRKGNQSLSTAIKIIMNSFYGVLGSNVCRFFDQRLSGSITLRGHQVLQQTRAEIEATFGYNVIYGDTDSVFVHVGDDVDSESAAQKGRELSLHLNRWWREEVAQRFAVESHLELEYETHFVRFLMPRMRHSEKGTKKRYAGLQQHDDGRQVMVFKGLENVRSDWTLLARDVQNWLYEAVFRGDSYVDRLKDTVAQLRAGKLDELLIYRRRLRQPVADYDKVRPPHVQAAIKAQQYWQAQGRESPYRTGSHVSYVMTVNGPEPIENRVSAIDYEHYLEKQLTPVVDTILVFEGKQFSDLIALQRDLFT